MSVYQKNNGKWYCRFQFDRKRHNCLCRGATTETQARKIESQLMFKFQQIENGVLKEDSKAKVKDIVKLYKSYAKTNKKSYGREAYAKYIEAYFKANTLVKDITPSRIENFKDYLKDVRHSSNATINKYLMVISKMFSLAIANKLIDYNPIKDIRKLRENNYTIRWLSDDEEKRMYDIISTEYQYLLPIVTCALQTGMRRGEIFNLKWSNINQEYNYIELLETKSGKKRNIPINATLQKILDNQPKINEYVFLNSATQKPYTDIHNSWHTIMKKANIENFRFHDLRHTVATRLVARGVDLITIKEILGHSKIDTTMRYAHAIPERKVEAINLL